MSKLFTLLTGTLVAVATWFLLFVIIGTGLGTAFIAGGIVLFAAVLAAVAIGAAERRVILDAPLTSTGLLAGLAAFVVLEVVLSVPMWVGVVTGLGVMGLYDIARAVLFPVRAAVEEEPVIHRHSRSHPRNGHDRRDREPVGAH